MLKDILIKKYKGLFIDIINEYSYIINKDNRYFEYINIFKYEIKTIIDSFETLLDQKKNTFKCIFENDNESILYFIDKDLFKYIKSVFENVSTLLNTK